VRPFYSIRRKVAHLNSKAPKGYARETSALFDLLVTNTAGSAPGAMAARHEPLMTLADTLLRPDLLAKYSANGPRYTSYPTALQFHETFDPADYLRAAADPAAATPDLSLYFHIPFLRHRLLLLRLQQGRDEKPRAWASVSRSVKARNGLAGSRFRHATAGVAIAFGRRHAHLFVARRNGRVDPRHA
jgi:hypothetical protein